MKYGKQYSEISGKLLGRAFEEGQDANLVFSPFSLLALLGMLMECVDGETREEIRQAVGGDFSYNNLKKTLTRLQKDFVSGDDLVSSNALCVREDLKATLRPGFEKKLDGYDGRIFSSKNMVDDINKWAEKNTKGMVSQIADESVKDMVVGLLNAVAFEDKWEEPYEDHDVWKEEFHNSDGTKSSIDMLHRMEDIYVEDQCFTGFVKPYASGDYSYMALLPRKRGKMYMDYSLERLDLNSIYKKAIRHKVHTTMPEFTYDSEKELTDFCKDLGITTAFSDYADFSPLSSVPLKVDSIKQKAHIEVDRQGSKAAAVSFAAICLGCAPDFENPPKEVRLDRPFLYAIVHHKTGLPVFVGMVNKVGLSGE